MTASNARRVPLTIGGRFDRAARNIGYALAMASAVLSGGVLPAVFVGGSTEAESSEEGPASQYAEVRCELRARLRRPSADHTEAHSFALHVPTIGRHLAHATTGALSAPCVSLGLVVPLRC